MKVINILEENNGIIGTVASYEAAIHFLVTNNWIEGNNEIFFEYNETANKVRYINLLKNFDIDRFNKMFSGWIKLDEVEVYDKTFEKSILK